jgi:hypothetical protein
MSEPNENAEPQPDPFAASPPVEQPSPGPAEETQVPDTIPAPAAEPQPDPYVHSPRRCAQE